MYIGILQKKYLVYSNYMGLRSQYIVASQQCASLWATTDDGDDGKEGVVVVAHAQVLLLHLLLLRPTVLRRRSNPRTGLRRWKEDLEPRLSSSSIAQLPGHQFTPTHRRQVTVIPKSENGESILPSRPSITLSNCNRSLPTSIRPPLGEEFVGKDLKFCVFSSTCRHCGVRQI